MEGPSPIKTKSYHIRYFHSRSSASSFGRSRNRAMLADRQAFCIFFWLITVSNLWPRQLATSIMNDCLSEPTKQYELFKKNIYVCKAHWSKHIYGLGKYFEERVTCEHEIPKDENSKCCIACRYVKCWLPRKFCLPLVLHHLCPKRAESTIKVLIIHVRPEKKKFIKYQANMIYTPTQAVWRFNCFYLLLMQK